MARLAGQSGDDRDRAEVAALAVHQGGQLSLAQPAFAGVGAIVAARTAAEAGWSMPVAVAAGGVAGGVAGALLGTFLLARVTGLRLAALSLTLAAACAGTLFTWPKFAGSGEARTLGVPALGGIDLSGRRYTVLVVAVVAGREHDRAAEGLGLPVLTARWLASTIAGAVAGLAGALTGYQLGTVAPEQFHPLTALVVLTAAALGGIGTLWGAAIGAVVVTVAPELLRQADAPTAATLVSPALLLGIVLLRPGGLANVRPPTRPPRGRVRGTLRAGASGAVPPPRRPRRRRSGRASRGGRRPGRGQRGRKDDVAGCRQRRGGPVRRRDRDRRHGGAHAAERRPVRPADRPGEPRARGAPA